MYVLEEHPASLVPSSQNPDKVFAESVAEKKLLKKKGI